MSHKEAKRARKLIINDAASEALSKRVSAAVDGVMATAKEPGAARPLTVEMLKRATALLSEYPALTRLAGVTVRPDVLKTLRAELVALGEPGAEVDALVCRGVELFEKEGQVEPYREWYDREKMNAYLRGEVAS